MLHTIRSATLLLVPFTCLCTAAFTGEPAGDGELQKHAPMLEKLQDKFHEPPGILSTKRVETGDNELRKLLNARYNERLTITLVEYTAFGSGNAGSTNIDALIASARKLFTHGMDLAD